MDPGLGGRAANWIAFVVWILANALDPVIYKRVTDRMVNYNIAMRNLFWPLSYQALAFILTVAYIICRRRTDRRFDWRFLSWRSRLASSSGAVPIHHLAAISFLDQLTGALGAPASAYVSNPLQSMLGNFSLVLTIGISACWFRTRYRPAHIIAALSTVAGVLVSVAPLVQDNDCSEHGIQHDMCINSYKTADGTYKQLPTLGMLVWYGLFVVRCIPTALEGCYEQHILQHVTVDVFYAAWWLANWQILWGVCFLPMAWVDSPNWPRVRPGETNSWIARAWSCFVGEEPTLADSACVAPGGAAIWWFFLDQLLCSISMVLTLRFTKHMSATWVIIGNALSANLTNVLSQLPALMGESAAPVDFSMWLAMVITALALWTYDLAEEANLYTDRPQVAAGRGDELEVSLGGQGG